MVATCWKCGQGVGDPVAAARSMAASGLRQTARLEAEQAVHIEIIAPPY